MFALRHIPAPYTQVQPRFPVISGHCHAPIYQRRALSRRQCCGALSAPLFFLSWHLFKRRVEGSADSQSLSSSFFHHTRSHHTLVHSFLIMRGLFALTFAAAGVHAKWTSVARSFVPDSAAVPSRRAVPTDFEVVQPGKTGVSAMQLVVVSETQAMVIDRVEHNALQTPDGKPAWAALYGLDSYNARAVEVLTNTFCAGGGFLGNGTLVSIGGTVEAYDNIDPVDGWQAVRQFNPSACSDDAPSGSCSFYENPDRLRLSVPRWYPANVKLDDGSIMVVGGTKFGNYINNKANAQNSFEYYPAKDIAGSNGLPIDSQFLKDAMNANLFPIVHLLPDGRVFIAANT